MILNDELERMMKTTKNISIEMISVLIKIPTRHLPDTIQSVAT
jgi:hypothetical protein